MKKFFSYFIFLSLIFVFSVLPASAKEINVPTILKIGKKISNEENIKFFIEGLTEKNTDILIYINGIFIDFADINIKNTATNSFYYENELKSKKFEVMAIARDKKTYILSPPTVQEYNLSPLPAPTIVFPKNNEKIIGTRIDVVGLSQANNIVEIYIDGKRYGETKLLTHESGTANFSYQNNDILAPGDHSLYLLARNWLGMTSKISKIINFKIEHPMPAPTLFIPVVNSNSRVDQPFIVGVAKNNSLVEVFVDNEYDGEFQVKNHKSGTANFAYKTKNILDRGRHIFYTTAIDYLDKESKKSNIIEYKIRKPAISEAVQEKKEEIVERIIKTNKESNIEPEKTDVVSGKNNISQEEEKEDTGIILSKNDKDKEIQNDDVKNGPLNEDKQKQGKMNLDLIIFLAFLLGIILWIIWVNKELIKEKRETEEKNKKP